MSSAPSSPRTTSPIRALQSTLISSWKCLVAQGPPWLCHPRGAALHPPAPSRSIPALCTGPPGATILVGQRTPTVVGDAQPFPTTTPGTSMAVALGWDEEGEKTVTGYQRTLTTWCPLARGGKQFSSALQSLLSRASIPGAQPCGSTNDLVLRSFALAAGGLHRTGGSAPPAPSPTRGSRGVKPLAKCWTKPQA